MENEMNTHEFILFFMRTLIFRMKMLHISIIIMTSATLLPQTFQNLAPMIPDRF